MKLTNETSMEAGWTMAFRPDGREAVVVAIKGTYVLVDREASPGRPRLAEEPVPLLMADTFGEDPAKNAPIEENDFAPVKPECDVLFSGAAYAPQGRPTKVVGVGLRVGDAAKKFNVTGPRSWKANLAGNLAAGDPEPIVRQPISYDLAFGGVEPDPRKPDHFETFLENPAGRGFAKHNLKIWGQPMPVTEELDDPITTPRKAYRPMALGPLGRHWKQRLQYAGTYNQDWIDNVAPMLPTDFVPLYFQAAPADQRIPYPRGGESIRLVNLVPPTLSSDACAQTSVPQDELTVVFRIAGKDPVWVGANLDTILIEPDENRFACTWRASFATTRDLFDVKEMIVINDAPGSDARLRAQLAGKQHYQGLGELARARRDRRR